MLLSGITTEDLVWHFNLRNEFVFAGCKAPKNDDKEKETLNKLNSSSNEFVRIMTVVDVKGISMRDVTSDVIRLALHDHYLIVVFLFVISFV